MEDDVLRLKVVVDYFLFAVVQVLETGKHLRYDQFSLFLLDLLRLLKVIVEVRPTA